MPALHVYCQVKVLQTGRKAYSRHPGWKKHWCRVSISEWLASERQGRAEGILAPTVTLSLFSAGRGREGVGPGVGEMGRLGLREWLDLAVASNIPPQARQPNTGLLDSLPQNTWWRHEESHCGGRDFPQEKGQTSPSPNETLVAAEDPAGCGSSHFATD